MNRNGFVSISLLWILAEGRAPGQVMTTTAGNGNANVSGDGGLASKATVNKPVRRCRGSRR